MMTMREARLRAQVHRGIVVRRHTGDYHCWLEEWTARERAEKSGYFIDVEDAVIWLGKQRKLASA